MRMRTCKVCGKTKNLNDFANNGNRKRHTCKECETKRILEKTHITVAYVQSLKDKCEKCGYNKDKSALEFHHMDENTKSFSIGAFASSRTWSKKTKELIDGEVKKCKCICANCHREEHSKQISEEEIKTIDFSFKNEDKTTLAKKSFIYNARKFSKDDVVKIRQRYREDNKLYSCQYFAQEYNCSIKTIRRIINRQTYKDIS